jgi:acetylglutamate kinase
VIVPRQELHVIKIGGNAVDNAATLASVLDAVASLRQHAILVHGGGAEATSLARRLGIEPVMVDGRRVTDAAMLDVAVMLYAGLINKRIIAGLAARGVTAVGLAGADGDVVRAKKRDIGDVDYGFVGDVTKINDAFLKSLLAADLLPILAPLSHDGAGQMLNTNADTIAAAVASAMADAYTVSTWFCFDRAGVCLDPADEASVVPVLDRRRCEELTEVGVVSRGMLPKLQNGFSALNAGVHRVHLLHANALAAVLSGREYVGTELRP